MKSLCFALFSLLLLATTVQAQTRAPIVVLNGVAGTIVYGKLQKQSSSFWWCDLNADWYRMWISTEELAPYAIDCLCENMAMTYNNQTGNYDNYPGVSINATSDFGGFDSMAYLDPTLATLMPYMAPLVQYFEGLGYTVGVDLFGAPYDWRIAADAQQDYFNKLQSLIENAVNSVGVPAVLVAHSMGGLMSLKFLQSQTHEWKSKYIKAWVPIDAPWGGAVNALMGVLSGYNFGVKELPHDWFRPLQISTPSMAFFLPVPGDGSDGTFASNQPLVWTPSTNYTAFDFPRMFQDEGLVNFPVMYERVAPLVLPGAFSSPLVPTYITYGYNVTTTCGLLYNANLQPGVQPPAPTSTYFECNPNGDGTVNIQSLQRGELTWAAAHAAAGITLEVLRVPNMQHMHAVANPQVLAYILAAATS